MSQDANWQPGSRSAKRDYSVGKWAAKAAAGVRRERGARKAGTAEDRVPAYGLIWVALLSLHVGCGQWALVRLDQQGEPRSENARKSIPRPSQTHKTTISSIQGELDGQISASSSARAVPSMDVVQSSSKPHPLRDRAHLINRTSPADLQRETGGPSLSGGQLAAPRQSSEQPLEATDLVARSLQNELRDTSPLGTPGTKRRTDKSVASKRRRTGDQPTSLLAEALNSSPELAPVTGGPMIVDNELSLEANPPLLSRDSRVPTSYVISDQPRQVSAGTRKRATTATDFVKQSVEAPPPSELTLSPPQGSLSDRPIPARSVSETYPRAATQSEPLARKPFWAEELPEMRNRFLFHGTSSDVTRRTDRRRPFDQLFQ